MTTVVNIGMNYETAPIEMRECLASDTSGAANTLARMKDLPCIEEVFFLSTCNRVEALFTTENISEAKDSMISLMSTLAGIPFNRIQPCLYIFEEIAAIEHIFRVASSLDSMVLGEPQILGQVKDAYQEATRQRTSGVILNRMLHRAFHVAKRVRTETAVCESAVSISYAAVELAKKIFHTLEERQVLLIGAGEMAELAARHFISNGVKAVAVANRTFQRAVEMASKFNANPLSFDEIPSQLLEADIVLTSTASPEYVLTHDQVKRCLRKRRNRPLFLIDIAVPRDVQPEINELDNVYVYDLDDLKGIIELNMEKRREEAVKAERIIQEEAMKFERWTKTLQVVPTIVSMKEKAENIVQNELKKSSSKLGELTPEQKEEILVLSKSIAEKLLNDPISFLKKQSDKPALTRYLEISRRLFNLNED